MAGSAAFRRIHAEVLAVLRAIPPGQIATFAEIGRFLDVMPRHVAYIVALLDDGQRASVPWHRAVSADGRLRRARFDVEGTSQADLLAAEGVPFSAPNAVDLRTARLWRPTVATTGLRPTAHPSRR